MKNKRLQLELDEQHIPILVHALEAYSRLRSGQAGMALDSVFHDLNLSWDEKNRLEAIINSFVYPASPERKYDGHGSFYDQYGNVYDKKGEIHTESVEWKPKKNRPHLDRPNSYFGVSGSGVMRTGTIAWEIKKAIEEYLHYERNGGYRTMTVDGDGVLNLSGIPDAKIVTDKGYWIPTKSFKIPKKYQEKIKKAVEAKDYNTVWDSVDKAFKKKPLPSGSGYRVEEIDGSYSVTVTKPTKATWL